MLHRAVSVTRLCWEEEESKAISKLVRYGTMLYFVGVDALKTVVRYHTSGRLGEDRHLPMRGTFFVHRGINNFSFSATGRTGKG